MTDGTPALIQVNSAHEPDLGEAVRDSGLPSDGVDRGYGIVAINSRGGIYCFRGHWRPADLETARARGVGVFADTRVSLGPPATKGGSTRR